MFGYRTYHQIELCFWQCLFFPLYNLVPCSCWIDSHDYRSHFSSQKWLCKLLELHVPKIAFESLQQWHGVATHLKCYQIIRYKLLWNRLYYFNRLSIFFFICSRGFIYCAFSNFFNWHFILLVFSFLLATDMSFFKKFWYLLSGKLLAFSCWYLIIVNLALRTVTLRSHH